MALKIDWGKFQKKSADKDKTTLVHEDGHMLTLAHRALSKDSLKQLSKLKMAEGGTVTPQKKPAPKDDVPEPNPQKAKEISEGATSSGWRPEEWKKNIKTAFGMAEGGEVAQDDNAPMQDEDGNELPDEQEQAPEAEGSSADQPLPQQDDLNQLKTQVDGLNASPQASAQPTSPQQSGMPQEGLQPMDAKAPNAIQQAMASNDKLDKQEMGIRQSEGNALAANETEAAKKDQEFAESAKKNLSDYQQEALKLGADISEDKIDQNAYWNDHSRVASAIGMALMAAGGQGEAAMNFLNNAINRNIDAQKHDIAVKKDKSKTMLASLENQYGNKVAAEKVAAAAQAASYLHKAQAIAAKSNSPLAQINLQRMHNQFAAQYGQQLEKAAALTTVDRALDTNDDKNIVPALKALDRMGPEEHKRAEEIRKRYIPGVGVAKVPLTRFDKEGIFARQNLLDSVSNLRGRLAANPYGSMNPKEKAETNTLAAEVQGLYSLSIKAAKNENEQKTIESIVSSTPESLVQRITSDNKLKALNQSMGKSLNLLKKQKGLPESSLPDDPEVKQAMGRTWRKVGPNRWEPIS